jgi:hypothetical protein
MPFWQIEGLILYALLCGYTCSASIAKANIRIAIQAGGRRPVGANPAMRMRLQR